MRPFCESLYCRASDPESDKALQLRIQQILGARLQSRLEKTVGPDSDRTDGAHRDTVRFFERLAALGHGSPESAAAVARHWSTTFLLARREELGDSPQGRRVADSLAGLFLGLVIRQGCGPNLRIETSAQVLDLIAGQVLRVEAFEVDGPAAAPETTPESSVTWHLSESGVAVDVSGRRYEIDSEDCGSIRRVQADDSGPWRLPIFSHPERFGHPGVPQSSAAESSGLLSLGQSLTGAHALLSQVWPEVVEQLPKVVPAFVELPGDHGSKTHLSCSYGPATPIFLSRVEDPALHAEDLVHELQHERFYAAFGPADFACLTSSEKAYISPFRSDPRPLRGLLLGLHAFVAVNELRLRLLEAELVTRSDRGLRYFAKSHGKNLFAYRTLMEFDVAGARGRVLMAEIGEQLAGQHRRLVDTLPKGGLTEVEAFLQRHVATFEARSDLLNAAPRFWALDEIAAFTSPHTFNHPDRPSMEFVQ